MLLGCRDVPARWGDAFPARGPSERACPARGRHCPGTLTAAPFVKLPAWVAVPNALARGCPGLVGFWTALGAPTSPNVVTTRTGPFAAKQSRTETVPADGQTELKFMSFQDGRGWK